jgi:hypothetical protein
VRRDLNVAWEPRPGATDESDGATDRSDDVRCDLNVAWDRRDGVAEESHGATDRGDDVWRESGGGRERRGGATHESVTTGGAKTEGSFAPRGATMPVRTAGSDSLDGGVDDATVGSSGGTGSSGSSSGGYSGGSGGGSSSGSGSSGSGSSGSGSSGSGSGSGSGTGSSSGSAGASSSGSGTLSVSASSGGCGCTIVNASEGNGWLAITSAAFIGSFSRRRRHAKSERLPSEGQGITPKRCDGLPWSTTSARKGSHRSSRVECSWRMEVQMIGIELDVGAHNRSHHVEPERHFSRSPSAKGLAAISNQKQVRVRVPLLFSKQ